MIASYNTIQKMAAKLPHCVPPMELVDFKDPEFEKQDPGGEPPLLKNQLQTAQERWLLVNKDNKDLEGPVVFRVTLLGRAAPGKNDASPFIDPVDENCTGCVKWAENEIAA